MSRPITGLVVNGRFYCPSCFNEKFGASYAGASITARPIRCSVCKRLSTGDDDEDKRAQDTGK